MWLLKHQGSNVGVQVGGGSRTQLFFFLSCLLELPFIEPPDPPWCDQALTGFGDRALRSAGVKLGSVTEVLAQGTAKEFLPSPALKGIPSYRFHLLVVLAPTRETPIVPVPCSGTQALKSGGRTSPTEL